MGFHSYVLAPGVNVRPEKFGLLFYDYRGPRLYFLPSKDWVPAEFFDGIADSSELVESLHQKYGWSKDLIWRRMSGIFTMLEAKGLIHEQPIC